MARTKMMSRNSIGALVLGVVLLGAMVFFAVGLPELDGEESHSSASALPDLPASIPGGWEALEEADAAAGADGGNAEAIAYVNGVLDDVYPEEGTAFRAYVNEEQQALVTATLFGASGGAFAPANGVADPAQLGLDRAPVELTRDGDAVCVTSYQSSAQATGGAEAGAPLSVSCQRPHGDDATLQIGAQGLSVEATVALLDELDAALES